jgi:hypothetical protein
MKKIDNELEQLIRDNYDAFINCKHPNDQILLAIDMVYQKEIKNCKENETVRISIQQKEDKFIIHGECVPK